MNPVWVGILAFLLAGPAAAQTHVSFPTSDGGLVYADQYGKGDPGVVLAHGGRFNKESWGKQGAAAGGGGISRLGDRFPRRS